MVIIDSDLWEFIAVMGVTLALWLPSLFILKRTRTGRIILVINGLIQMAYSAYFLYNLEYNGSGGMRLVWGLYFMFFNVGHALLMLLGSLGVEIFQTRGKLNR